MKIKILGSRGEIKPSSPYHSKNSGILIDNEILFDVGEKKFLEQNPKYIFITHLHPDHAFFIRKPKKSFEEINVPIYGPENYFAKDVKIQKLKSRKKLTNVIIIPIPTIHSIKVPSQAYLIKTKKEKILYTGDMIEIDQKYYHQLKNLDLIITEASYFRKGGLIRKHKISGKKYGHAGIPDLIALFSKFTNNILFTHFGSWFYKDTQKAKKKLIKLTSDYNLNVIIGYDGLEIETMNLPRHL